MRQTSPFSLYNKSSGYTSVLLCLLWYTFLLFVDHLKLIKPSNHHHQSLAWLFFNIVIRDLCCALFKRWGKILSERTTPAIALKLRHQWEGQESRSAVKSTQPRTGARCCVLESKRGGGNHRLVSSKCQVFREKMTVQNLFSGGLRLSF